MSAAKLVDRLDRVKTTGPSKWVARCPAHEDKNPSLSVRETDDGRVLVHCFGGCSVHDVVAAVGLEMSDLFPPRDPGFRPATRRPWTAAELLHLLDRESLVVIIGAADAVAGKEMTPEHLDRVSTARRRLSTILRELPAP